MAFKKLHGYPLEEVLVKESKNLHRIIIKTKIGDSVIVLHGFTKKEGEPTPKKEYGEESLKLQTALTVYERRKEKRFSQAKLAEKAKTTQKVISRIEQGQVSVGIGLLQRIAACLNLKVSIAPR